MVSTFEKYFVYYCFHYDLDFNDLDFNDLDFNNYELKDEKNIYNSNIDYYNKKIMSLIFRNL
jgi:hypothetical protein